MNHPELMENPFSLDPSLKSLLTYKAQEKSIVAKEEHYNKPHDRLYYGTNASQNYGLIKRLEEQALGLSDMREQLLNSGKKSTSGKSTPSSDNKFSVSFNKPKTELPAINQNRKARTNTLALAEKKETMKEFLEKGKQMFLEKMMTNMKREETLRLAEFIINEEETLNEHEADFREHVKFSNMFIQELNKDAENTFLASKNKSKDINAERSKIAQLEQQIKTIESQIKKKEEEKEIYDSYKKFCEELYQSPAIKYLSNIPEPAKPKEDPSKFFLTQDQNGVVEEGNDNKEVAGVSEEVKQPAFNFGNPKQIVELLKLLDDATIFLIHNTQEREEELEKSRKAMAANIEQINEKYNNRKESLNNVQKLYEKLKKEKDQAYEKLNRLKLLEKAPHKDAEENGSLDKEKIMKKIQEMNELFNQDKNAKESVQHVTNTDDALKAMEGMEKELEELIKFYNEARASESKSKMLNDIERNITIKRRQDNANAKLEADRLKNLEALEKQKNKKVVVRKGRKAMGKTVVDKEEKVEEVVDEDLNRNDDEKYFKESFAFMDIVKTKGKPEDD